MESASHDAWKLISLSPLPAWALGVLIALVVFGSALAAWGVRREPARRSRLLLWTLRGLAAVFAIVFLLEPGIRHLQVARVKNRVAVLVDRSASMGFGLKPGGPTRTAAVADALENLGPQMEAMKDRYAFEVMGFDPELAPMSPSQLRAQPPLAGRTDLLGALRNVAASDGAGTRKLAGVLVFSDGADNAELSQGLTSQARRLLNDLAVPVSTAAVGQGDLKDLSIDAIKVDDFAFVRNSVTAEIELHARGFKGQAVPVVLRREGQTVGTKTVLFESDDDSRVVSFTFQPDQTGRFVYTASMPVFPDEAVAENNTRSFALKVIRDRVRVLLVAGRPTWDERFLRGLLRSDANIELISFYILRSNADESGSERELSLIPFPRDEIFREKINTFDLVVMVNFGSDDMAVGLAGYQDDIRRYVLNGGALAFLGGDRTFGEARQQGLDPFAAVLPVESAGPADLSSFRPRLTPDGQRHPITAVGTGGLSTDAAWDALPEIPGLNLVRARPGATVLLEHPTVQVNGQGAPLLSIWEHGRGRVMALATDGTWHWAFTSHAEGSQQRTWERFWGNAIRWLVRDPDLTSLSITADPPGVEPGHPVTAVVVARTPDYQPAPGAIVTVQLVSADNGQVVASQQLTAGPDGTVRVEFNGTPPGAYKLVARAVKGDQVLGESSDAVAVRAVGPELADARVNTGLLEAIAKASGGKAFTSTAFALSDVPFAQPPLVEVGRSKDQPLWDRWYWLVLAVAVLGLEWGLRRRLGYV